MESKEAPAQEAALVLSPWKMFAWGFILGSLLIIFLGWMTPWYRGWLRLEDARTEAQVQRILRGEGR